MRRQTAGQKEEHYVQRKKSDWGYCLGWSQWQKTGAVWKYISNSARGILQLLCIIGWEDGTFGYSRCVRGGTVFWKSGACARRTETGLSDCQSHGTGSLCDDRGSGAPLSGSAGGRKHQDIWNDKTVLRNGFRGESRDGKRGRYACNRCAYIALCDGADGTLAGGNGNLWWEGQGAFCCGRIRNVWRIERQYFCGWSRFWPRLAGWCQKILHEHCRKVRCIGAGIVKESLRAGDRSDLPAPRTDLEGESGLYSGKISEVEHLWGGGSGGCDSVCNHVR